MTGQVVTLTRNFLYPVRETMRRRNGHLLTCHVLLLMFPPDGHNRQEEEEEEEVGKKTR